MSIDRMDVRQLGPDAEPAMRAVTEAMVLMRALERETASVFLAKDDSSPVTIADFSVQALISARLALACPSDPLVAEEGASALRRVPALAARVAETVSRADPALARDEVCDWVDRGGGVPGGRFWVLDPVDGTRGLLRGGQYAVALALIEDGVVIVGVLGCPRLAQFDPLFGSAVQDAGRQGGLAIAVRDRGSWWSPGAGGAMTRLSVSGVKDLRRARVLHSYEARHGNVEGLRRVVESLGLERPPWLMDSQTKHVVVAGGVGDVVLRIPPHAGFRDAIWDQAAGALLIEEAGGRVTDLAGQSLDFSRGRRLEGNEGLVASNGALHEAMLGAVHDVLWNSSSLGAARLGRVNGAWEIPQA